jgi:uncharacterized membrane protein YedE/YeeE
MNFLTQPWPWYVAGPLIGLMVPALLIIGNKSFGISSSLRHICACVLPANIPFLKYDWKKDIWNMYFVAGLMIGGFLCVVFLKNTQLLELHPDVIAKLNSYHFSVSGDLMPTEFSSMDFLLSWRGLVMMIGGGFLIGFGSRFAGGCTSGHAIMGLSNLQLPSLVSVIGFFVGGLVMVHLVLPYLLGR